MTNTELLELLERAGLRQADAAWLCGVSERQVRAWCTGEYPVPQYGRLLLRAYDENLIRVDWLKANIDRELPA